MYLKINYISISNCMSLNTHVLDSILCIFNVCVMNKIFFIRTIFILYCDIYNKILFEHYEN